MPVDRQLLLRFRQPLTRGHTQLPFHQINAGNRLGHRVFHLQTGIHFHEPEPVGAQPVRAINDELNRPCALVSDRLGGTHTGGPHRGAHLFGHARSRSFLDHLLMASLQRAVPLEQMHRFFAITKDLHLDMARFTDKLLDQHGVIAKGCPRLGTGRGQRIHEIRRFFHQAHALAAAASHGLDQHRIANGVSRTRQMLGVLVVAVIPWHHGHACLMHQSLGGILQPHRTDRFRRRANKNQPRSLDRIHEIGVFRQKPVPRMDRLRAGCQCHANDLVAFQVTLRRRRPPDMNGLVRHRHMLCGRIRI